MKNKYFTFLVLLSCLYKVSAQDIKIELAEDEFGTNPVVINGTCIEVIGTSKVTSIDEEFLQITNTSSATMSIALKRKELDVDCNTQHAVCWGLCPAPTPSCTVNEKVQGITVDVAAGNTDFSLSGHHYPQSSDGYSIYRYTAYDINNTSNEAYFDIIYTHGVDNPRGGCLLALDENNKVSFVVSPNPASNEINIKVENGRNYNVQLINVLGKVVMNEQVISDKSLNVAEFDRGVYFIRITDSKGEVVKSSKIVLK